MSIKIIIITSNSLRHIYFRKLFSNKIQVLKTFCEESSTDFKNLNFDHEIERIHFEERLNSESDFFSDIINVLDDKSNPHFISKNQINKSEIVDEIISMKPDFIVTYGCSIIKGKLLEIFNRKIINVHLGISPYYFGAATNFHALVNNDYQCVGYTFMYMDSGIDTGEIIHQKRAVIRPFDNPHTIGNRLIKDMTNDFIKLILNFDKIEAYKNITEKIGKTYKNKDCNLEKIQKLYKNYHNRECLNYLNNLDKVIVEFPIIEQKILK